MLNENQIVIYKWLSEELQYPVFAEAFNGAVHFINDKPPGYITFVCHMGRDFTNLLAKCVKGIKSVQTDYQKHLNTLQDDWRDEWGISNISLPDEVSADQLIPFTVCQQIRNLIEDHKSGTNRDNDSTNLFFQTFLDYADKDNIPDNLLKEWKATKKWFVKHAHLRKDNFYEDISIDIESHFKVLENFLYIAASSEYRRIKELNEILDAANS